MTLTKTVAALAAGLALLLGSAPANAAWSGDSAWSLEADASDGSPCGEAASAGGTFDEEPLRLVAEVVAIDTGAGVAMLATRHGMLTLQATPDTLAQLGIGDTIVVELVDHDTAPKPTERLCV